MSLPDVGSATSSFAVPAAKQVSRWPLITVIVLSAMAIFVAAFFQTFWISVVTYLVVLLAGCGLLFYQRVAAINVTRKAGGTGFVGVTNFDRVALLALVAACLANGVVIAFEMARWNWGG